MFDFAKKHDDLLQARKKGSKEQNPQKIKIPKVLLLNEVNPKKKADKKEVINYQINVIKETWA